MKLALVLTHAAVIDRYGELLRLKAEAEVRITKEVGLDLIEMEAVESEIKSWYLDHPAEQPAVAEGQQYFLEVTPCEFRRELDIKAKREIFKLLKAKLGADPLGLFGITLEAVKTHLGTAKLEELATKGRVGPRKLKAIAKAPLAQSAKAA
jgi:hypothetical protein